jgi:cellobiose phosphorylase
VQHWWNYPSNAGVRTKISDDLLWLPYVVNYYIEKTGDVNILNEDVSYLEMQSLEQHEESVYAIPNVSEEKGNVLDHCLRAINKSLNFGAHGLPLIGSGDWNDSLNSVGDEGKGESVWLGWFLFNVLDNFTKILENTNRRDDVPRYVAASEELKKNLDASGWDGNWYLRAFYDDGTPLGSHINNECVIDSISQSWSVISKAGSPEKVTKAMESHEKYLENKDKKIINLLTPPFKDSNPFPGYIQGYPEGIRENGGQYTHGAVWAMKAYAMQKRGNKAYELFDMLNPISHSLDKKSVMEYKCEPYVMVGDVYSNPQHLGRGGWSWYTGSAGWIYQVAIEDILGFKKYADFFTMDPVIPEVWSGFEMKYVDGDSTYNIKVKRGKNKGLYIAGKKSDEQKVLLRKGIGNKDSGDIEVSLII